MRIAISVCFVCALMNWTLAVHGAGQRPYFAIDGMSARFAISVYEKLTGKTVVMTEEVKASKLPIFAGYGGDDRKEAIECLTRALLDQASVELVPQKDGKILARVVVRKKNA